MTFISEAFPGVCVTCQYLKGTGMFPVFFSHWLSIEVAATQALVSAFLKLSRENSFQIYIRNKEIASTLMLISLIHASMSCKYFF